MTLRLFLTKIILVNKMNFEFYCDKENIRVLEETHSTNNVAREWAKNGACEYSCVLAHRQTGGRGRLGRQFFSYDGGVYMSVILRPQIEPQESLLITVAAAVAAAEVIESISGKKTLIKWVNDIYIDGKKVCGILTEGNIEDGKLQFAILGIGVNILSPKDGFPSEISSIAGSVFEKETGDNEKSKFVSLFLEKFKGYYEKLAKKEYLDSYRKRNLLIGQEITYEQEGKTKVGKVTGIDDNASLVVEYEGKQTAISSGEVQIKSFKREK